MDDDHLRGAGHGDRNSSEDWENEVVCVLNLNGDDATVVIHLAAGTGIAIGCLADRGASRAHRGSGAAHTASGNRELGGVNTRRSNAGDERRDIRVGRGPSCAGG